MTWLALGLEWTKPNIGMPNVVGLSNGTLLVLWVEIEDGQGRRIKGQILDADGTAIGGEFTLDAVTSGALSGPVAVPLSNGRVAVAWDYNTDGIGAFEAQTAIVGANGEIEGDIKSLGAGAFNPEIAAFPDESYAVAYRQGAENKLNIFNPDGTLGDTPEVPDGSGQTIAPLSAGSVLSVVTTYNGSSSSIVAHLHRPDGQSASITIATSSGVFGAVQVATLASGNALIVWYEGNVAKARIVSSRGEALGGEITLFRATSGSLEELTVDALPNGSFALAFTTRSTEPDVGTDVYVGIYAADGSVVEAPSLVGRKSAGSQSAPSIAVLKDGRCVVSWHDLQDNSVHFQTYDPRSKGVTVSGDDASDRFTGTGFSDVLSGGGGADRLMGEGGNDVLDGGGGGDLMFGGAGDDTYYVDSTSDRIVEIANAGIDHVITTVSQDLWDEVENLTAAGTAAIALNGNELSNKITGNAGLNVLNGKAGNDSLDGGSGADSLIGGAGDDVFYIDHAGDQVVEVQGGGRDTIHASISVSLSAGLEIEVLAAAGAAGLTLKGNALTNTITGNAGANKLWGGLGNDQLTGGSGKDIFVFNTKAHKSKNKDRVADFKVADDTIWLDNKVFAKLGKKGSETKPAKLDKGFFVMGSKAKDKNDYLVYDKKKGVLLYDADGSGKGKAVEVATLSKNLKMTEKDFFVI